MWFLNYQLLREKNPRMSSKHFTTNCIVLLFLGSACFTKHLAPIGVPSFENGMPLKQRKGPVSSSSDVMI